MKTNLLNIMLGAMLVPLAAVLSCSKEQPTEPQPETGKYTITVAAGQIGGLTKTTVEGDGTAEKPYKSVWNVGDCAGLFIGKDANVRMTIDRIEDGVAYFKGELSEKPAAGEQIYFYYPYNEAQGESVTFNAVSCHFPYGQNPAGLGTYDDNVDYMWGNTVVGEDGTVSGLKLAYAVGFIRFSVKSVAGTVDFADGGSETLTKDDKVLTVSIEAKPADASAKKLVGDFTVNLENGECLVPEKSSENNVGPKVIINCPDGTTLGNLDVWACVHPFEMASPDDVLRFWIQTEKHYIIREVKVSDLKTTTFSVAAGQVKAFDVNITNSAWNISVNPYRGGVIKTPEQFLRFVQDVKNGSFLDGNRTIGGNQYATLAPDARVKNSDIDKWLDENGVAKLGNDITISTSAMSTYGNLASVPLWTKTFDGQGHTITFEDGTLLRPIFANVFKIDENSPGIVRNLKVAGNMTSPQVPYTQGTCPLVGILHDGEVIGCQSDVNINITSYDASLDGGNIAMAGICRTMQGGKISGCANNGNIIYKAANSGNSNQTKLVNAVYAGGIVALVGANYGDGAFGTNVPADADAPFMASPVISGCTNNGEISLINTATGTDLTWMQYSAAGGITAWVWGGNATKYLTIDGCHNTASINVEQAERGNATSGITGVGGIIGRAAPTGRYGSVLGPVYGSNGITYWSGKVSECQDGFYIEVKNSDNSGRIAATSKISQPETFFHKIGCGGIAGILFGQYNGTFAKIVGCTNTGEIVGCDKAIAEEKSVAAACSQNYISGGILGYAGSVHLSDCHQIGGIGQNGYNLAVGGIMGAAYNKFVVENCTVKADLFRYMPTTVSKDVFAALITNYMYTSGKGWTREANYNMYEGSEIKGCAVAGSVKYTKGTASGTARTDEQIKSSSDVNSLTYCALSNSDMASSIGNNAGGKITISGTTHYTE